MGNMVRRASRYGAGVNLDAWQRRAWCYLRNLVHTVYREARHVGPTDDGDAKLNPVSPAFAVAAGRCSKNRALLKGTSLFKKTAAATSVDEVLRPYRDITGLELADLVKLFAQPGWARNYGGQKWAAIARATIELAEALNHGDLDAALRVCTRVREIEHNTRRLVPSPEEWRSVSYLREKWPELCN